MYVYIPVLRRKTMKYNIALCGTFNVENYGDLMFPEIFKRALEKRGLQFELFLFSPEKSGKKALDESTVVYSSNEMDKIHAKNPFDAIVIGGGALIHYNKIAVKFPGEKKVTEYDIAESWYYPIEFAVRNNLNLLFNLPQVPFPFSKPFKALTRAAFDCCDYISLRDNISKQYLLDAYDNNPPKIDVYPDSVCCISDLIKTKELEEIRKSVLSFDDKYAVIQFNPQKPKSDDQYLIKIIDRLKTQGLKVVLLPIGYTHNDDFVLECFNTEYELDCELIHKKLSIMETAAVLSGCNIYIGSSFHGAITAIAYGKKAISYNYIFPKNKNQEIFKMYGISDFVVDDAESVLNLLNDLYEGKITFNPKTADVLSQLNQYFDNLYTMIINHEKSMRDYHKLVLPVIKTLPELSKLELGRKQLIADLTSQKEYAVKLEGIIKNYIDESNRCNKYISDLEKHYHNLENYCQGLEKNNQEQNDHIKSLEVQIQTVSSQLIETQSRYNKFRNNFIVRCLLLLRRFFTKK